MRENINLIQMFDNTVGHEAWMRTAMTVGRPPRDVTKVNSVAPLNYRGVWVETYATYLCHVPQSWDRCRLTTISSPGKIGRIVTDAPNLKPMTATWWSKRINAISAYLLWYV